MVAFWWDVSVSQAAKVFKSLAGRISSGFVSHWCILDHGVIYSAAGAILTSLIHWLNILRTGSMNWRHIVALSLRLLYF